MLPTLAESKSHQPCPVPIFVLSCDRDFTPDRRLSAVAFGLRLVSVGSSLTGTPCTGMESTSADSSSVVTFGSGGNAVPALVTSGEEATGSGAADVEVEYGSTLNADQQLDLEIARARQKNKSRQDAENESALASDQDRLSLRRLPSAATRKRSSTPNVVPDPGADPKSGSPYLFVSRNACSDPEWRVGSTCTKTSSLRL